MSQAKVLPFSRLSRVGAKTLRRAPLHHAASAPKKKQAKQLLLDFNV
jgi:hypothetical protein